MEPTPRNDYAGKWPEVGSHVIYCDEQGRDHDALVTACWASRDNHGWTWGPCINVLHVNSDPNCTDPYGRQIERPSSVSHGGVHGGVAHGRYWRNADEPRNVRKDAEL